MSFKARGRKAFEKRTIQASFTGHLTGLPHDILALFQPGPPLKYLPPILKKKFKEKIEGIFEFTLYLEKDTEIINLKSNWKMFINIEYRHQVRINKESLLKNSNFSIMKYYNKIIVYNPTCDPNIVGDPYKTLFIARLAYNVTERRLRKEFEEFGAISSIRIVSDKLTGKPRGYAFIEFERFENLKLAYKMGMNRNIEGRRVLVDIERGRTVAEWKPKKFGFNLALNF